jgi:hypothetical protein
MKVLAAIAFPLIVKLDTAGEWTGRAGRRN